MFVVDDFAEADDIWHRRRAHAPLDRRGEASINKAGSDVRYRKSEIDEAVDGGARERMRPDRLLKLEELAHRRVDNEPTDSYH